MIGVKRAKRIRALERETEIIKTSVEKLQRTHDAILSHCLAAAKDEAEKILQDMHLHWCQLMGFDVSDMSSPAIQSVLQRFDNFRRHQDQHELESQMGARDPEDDDNWMQNDLFGGVHVHCCDGYSLISTIYFVILKLMWVHYRATSQSGPRRCYN